MVSLCIINTWTNILPLISRLYANAKPGLQSWTGARSHTLNLFFCEANMILYTLAMLRCMVQCGFLFQPGGLWVGAHYSTYNNRWCINVLPCCTFWVCLPGGKVPDKAKA